MPILLLLEMDALYGWVECPPAGRVKKMRCLITDDTQQRESHCILNSDPHPPLKEKTI